MIVFLVVVGMDKLFYVDCRIVVEDLLRFGDLVDLLVLGWRAFVMIGMFIVGVLVLVAAAAFFVSGVVVGCIIVPSTIRLLAVPRRKAEALLALAISGGCGVAALLVLSNTTAGSIVFFILAVPVLVFSVAVSCALARFVWYLAVKLSAWHALFGPAILVISTSAVIGPLVLIAAEYPKHSVASLNPSESFQNTVGSKMPIKTKVLDYEYDAAPMFSDADDKYWIHFRIDAKELKSLISKGGFTKDDTDPALSKAPPWWGGLSTIGVCRHYAVDDWDADLHENFHYELFVSQGFDEAYGCADVSG